MRSRGRWLLRVLPTVAIALSLVAACSDMGLPPPIVFFNRTNDGIRVFAESPSRSPFEVTSGSETPPGANVTPRSDIFPGSSCSAAADLVVRDTAGTELGRTNGPVCPGDHWLVDGRGVRRSQPPPS